LEEAVSLAKTLLGVELSPDGFGGVEEFPVFFPVSREFGAEKSSHRTASTASQSLIFLSSSFSLAETGILRPNRQDFTRVICSVSTPIPQTD
jgi:hypothetical protein